MKKKMNETFIFFLSLSLAAADSLSLAGFLLRRRRRSKPSSSPSLHTNTHAFWRVPSSSPASSSGGVSATASSSRQLSPWREQHVAKVDSDGRVSASLGDFKRSPAKVGALSTRLGN